MLKLIIWILVIVVGYKLIKGIKSDLNLRKKAKMKMASPLIADVMLQDPYCKTYFSKNQGVVAHIRQKEIYFCCTECKKAFIDQLDSST